MVNWIYTIDGVENIIREYLLNLRGRLKHIEIVWFEDDESFQLCMVPVSLVTIDSIIGIGWHTTTIAYANKSDNDCANIELRNEIIEAGKELHFRFKNFYPVRRNMPISRRKAIKKNRRIV